MRLLRGKPSQLSSADLGTVGWPPRGARGYPSSPRVNLEGMDTERGMIRISFIEIFFFDII